MSFADRLRRIDAHSSVQSEFRVYTLHGAVVSVITIFLILYLTATEAYYNFQVVWSERVHVNATSPRGLELEFDVSLPHVPCSQLSVDANDPTGQPQSLHLDQQHQIWKHRMVTRNGARVLLGQKTKIELGSTLLSESDLLEDLQSGLVNSSTAEEMEGSSDPSCGSCYGAGEEGECCNSCDDVERAYKRKGWVLMSFDSISQCKGRRKEKTIDGEGCNVHGIVALSSGGGNLHLAPSRASASDSMARSIVDMLFQQFMSWNVSHTIHKVRFGPEYPQAINQLDDQSRTIEDVYGMYQYYFQVVPTKYVYLNGTTIQTNQYSVTEHLRHVQPGSGRGVPGVFFFYEVSPLHVEITETYQKGWIAFFTSMCAVVGGVVCVMGMVDQALFQSKRGRGGLAR